MSSPSPAWSLPEPIRAVPVNDPALPAGWTAQPKWVGCRAPAGRWAMAVSPYRVVTAAI
ncbi:hypothetical protein [Streptomyces sp. NPDC051001]|uniref:hypothetical protein n=1 Tax=Streptomyces sp. NPDC051001 TaxID=3155795 RepID=UPI00341590A5